MGFFIKKQRQIFYEISPNKVYETSQKSELILLNFSASENMRAVLRKDLIEE